MKLQYLLLLHLLCLITSYTAKSQAYRIDENRFILYEVDPKNNEVQFYWKDATNKRYSSLQSLKTALTSKGKNLLFATNGGMYTQEYRPQGLYIERGEVKQSIDRKKKGYGNFYLVPNGIFYLTEDNEAFVQNTSSFTFDSNISYATQSGPMLISGGQYNAKLTKGSKNLHIRNGVGILPNGNILFAMSKKKSNFYDLATLFKQKGCQNALYLDGFVSRTYLPSKNWIQLDGNFGVIIGVHE